MEENYKIISLTDEEGVEAEFEFLDLFPYKGKEYVVLLPVEDEDGDVLILEVGEDEEGNECLDAVEDLDILEAVFEMFKEAFADEFEFEE